METMGSQQLNPTQRRKGAEFFAIAELCASAPLREAFLHRVFIKLVPQTRYLKILSLVLVFAAGCTSSTTEVADQPNATKQLSHQVTAVSYPLAFFTQQLVGNSIDVQAIVPTDQSLESWRPTRQEIASMQRSDLIVVNGSTAPFAKWLPHVTLPESKLCQTANDGLLLSDMIAVKDIRIVHSHGPEGEHSHPTMVAYSWLDPAMAKKQVELLSKRLAQTYPANREQLKANQTVLVAKLDQLVEEVNSLADATRSQVVLTSRPDLKYLTRSLGWTDLHLAWSPTTGASEARKQLAEKRSSVDPNPTIMLWSDQPPAPLQTLSQAAKLTSVVIDTMSQSPATGDYFSTMRQNLQRLQTAAQ